MKFGRFNFFNKEESTGQRFELVDGEAIAAFMDAYESYVKGCQVYATLSKDKLPVIRIQLPEGAMADRFLHIRRNVPEIYKFKNINYHVQPFFADERMNDPAFWDEG